MILGYTQGLILGYFWNLDPEGLFIHHFILPRLSEGNVPSAFSSSHLSLVKISCLSENSIENFELHMTNVIVKKMNY